jgi:hypothetical protein
MKTKRDFTLENSPMIIDAGEPRVIPAGVDPKNVTFDLFYDVHLGDNSTLTLPCFNSNTPNFSLRFFNTCILGKKAKIEIDNFNIEESVKIIPDLNSTIGEGAKVKISTTKPSIFNKLKEVSDNNPTIEVSLKR